MLLGKPSNYAIKRDLRRNTELKPSFPSVGPLFWLLAGESIFSQASRPLRPRFVSHFAQHQGLSARCLLPGSVQGFGVFLFNFPVFSATALIRQALLLVIWRRA